MDYTAVAKLLEDKILSELNSLAGVVDLKQILITRMCHDQRGVLVDNMQHLPFLLLPVLTCEAVGGKYLNAIPTAASMQFFMTAADILDDLEDQDNAQSLDRQTGIPVALNAAVTLIFLAEKNLTEHFFSSKVCQRMLRFANTNYIKACQGQHLDLVGSKYPCISERQYLRVVGMKSASSLESACALGAIVGGAKRDKVAIFAKFGYYLGMSAQMLNDLNGVYSLKDVLNKKPTLPIIFAIRESENKDRKILKRYFSSKSTSETEAREIQQLIISSGAIHYNRIKIAQYRLLAKDQLSRLSDQGIQILCLETLLK